MNISGPGSGPRLNLTEQTNMHNQLNPLSPQLGTGEAAPNYSGLGLAGGHGAAVAAQISSINSYGSTVTNVGARLSSAQGVLGALDDGDSWSRSPSAHNSRSRSIITARRHPGDLPRANSVRSCRCSTRRWAAPICFPAPPCTSLPSPPTDNSQRHGPQAGPDAGDRRSRPQADERRRPEAAWKFRRSAPASSTVTLSARTRRARRSASSSPGVEFELDRRHGERAARARLRRRSRSISAPIQIPAIRSRSI